MFSGYLTGGRDLESVRAFDKKTFQRSTLSQSYHIKDILLILIDIYACVGAKSFGIKG